MSTTPRSIASEISEEARAYSPHEERPLGSYLGLMGLYGAVMAGLLGAVRFSGRSLPERVEWPDLVLTAVATHRVTRLLSKDPVTSPLRAPFTRFSGTSGPAELAEEVRGHGLRKAVGELVTCPFCLGQWVATAFMFGLVFAPRPTRMMAGIFSAVAGADFLQFARARVQD